MKIIIGSKNKTKIDAVKSIFPNAEITTKNIPSGVSDQPIGDLETMEGAINRAQAAQKYFPDYYGIGLEGGVMYLANELFLCNWGALVTPHQKMYTASGARIKLPQHFKKQITAGYELSMIMDEYTNRRNIRQHEGAIGIFTNTLVQRDEMFSHVVKLLRGQLEYWENE